MHFKKLLYGAYIISKDDIILLHYIQKVLIKDGSTSEYSIYNIILNTTEYYLDKLYFKILHFQKFQSKPYTFQKNQLKS